MNYSLYQVQSPDVQVHGLNLVHGELGGQQVGMVGSGRMALMEAPGHTYSLLR